MSEERLFYLIEKWLHQTCSEEERKELEDHGLEHPEVWRLIHLLEDKDRIESDLQGWQRPVRMLTRARWAAAAGGVVLLLWLTVHLVRRDRAEASGHLSTVQWATISTPKDKQLRLTLPDGTKVWMSHASSLSYPDSFSGPSREVLLSGEALFDVARDPAHPFHIRAKDCGIEVLGTEVDVMAYSDEVETRATLLSGSVQICRATEKQRLEPGQQLVVRPREKFQLQSDIDPGVVVAWKDGYFYFKRTPVADVLRRLSRYYGVAIAIKGRIDRSCNATLKMGLSLRLILDKLGLSVTYEKNGIVVSE